MREGADDYIPKQKARDAEYASTYRQWIESLSPAERAKLKAQGLDEPLIQKHGNGMLDEDLADSPLAKEEATFVDQLDEPQVTAASPGDVNEQVMVVLRRLLGEVLTQKNARLTLECLAVACGLTTLQGESMTSIARRHGVSRAAVSKRCVDITDKLNLPPSRAMRSPKARKVYQNVQKKLRIFYERTRDQRQ